MDHHTLGSLSGFRWWKRRQRWRYFRIGIWLILLPAIIAIALWVAGLENYSSGELLFALAFLLFFVGYGLYQWFLLLQTFRWQPSQCWFGTVVSTHITRLPNRRIRDMRIVAKVGEKQLEGICEAKTYRMAQPGQRILLFTVKGDQLYCVHPEM